MQPTNPTDAEQQRPKRPLRILCAEDDPLVLNVVSILLTRCGHSVDTASDGMQALAKVVSDIDAFDLVITDQQMPRLDGVGLVRQLRSADYSGKVIVLAGNLSPEARASFQELCVDRILSKSVKPDLLLQAIEDISDDSTNEA